jgi:phosphohistidine swiveling domain-containing protein
MENKLAMKMLGTTNIFKTFFLFIKWILKSQIAVDLANKIVSDINDSENKRSKIIAIGYLNEFFSKYLEFGKTNKEIVEINKKIDQKIKTGDKIADSLITLRDLRTKIKKFNRSKDDQVVPTRKSFGISQGIATGKVLNINNTKQIIPKNCIGLFPTSGIKYTTQFLKCIGIIFLNGGVTSHGAILAREFNIPAIVYPGLKINNNEIIEINGNNGNIKRGGS